MIFATTDDGQKIVLNRDGTWYFSSSVEETQDGESVQQLMSTDFQELTFRKTKWGMSKNQVRQSENSEVLLDDIDALAYEGNVAGFPVHIFYNFTDNELAVGSYYFNQEHVVDTDFINDYDQIKKNLIKKYGQPSEDNRYFTDDLFEDTPKEWGQALSRGGLSFFTKWTHNDTEMLLSLYGQDYKIALGITYSSIKHKDRLKQQHEEKVLDDL